MEEKEVTLNGNKLTESEFKEEKEKVEEQKGVKVIETEPGTFKTRLHD